MRKISMALRQHQFAGPGLLLVGLLLTMGACGDGGHGDDRTDAETGGARLARGCALVIDDHSLQAFYALADRVAAGQEVPLEEMTDLVSEPIWDRWRRSFEPEPLAAARVGRALFIALRGREDLPDRLRDKAAPSDLVGNYKLTLERREQIVPFVDAFIAEEIGCEVFGVLSPWLDASAMPDTVRIDVLVGHPEIRLYEDHVMLDAGLAWAAGREQLVRFLASVIYRDRDTIDGRDPDHARGEAILLETLRLVRNEAIPSLLDRMTEVTFDPRHRLLAGASPQPDEICLQAQRSIISLDSALDHVRSLAEPGDEDWMHLYRLFVGARSVQPTGWYMARVIEERFGQERLAAAKASVADFFAAYQEAALQSPPEPSAADGTLAWYLETAPRLSADNAAWLDVELRRQFPSSG